MNSLLVNCPAPAKVVGQVACRHAAKTAQPLMKTAVVAVDVLNVDGASDVFASAHVDIRMGDAGLPGECLVRLVRIGDQQRVAGRHRTQVLPELRSRDLCAPRHEIACLASPVTRHQNTNMFPCDARCARLATSPSGRPVQLARTFLRLEQKRLIGFRNARQADRAVVSSAADVG